MPHPLANSLLLSDLHLTSNPRDEYRWRIFDWVRSQHVASDAQALWILGDLTDAKDYHSAVLVNRLVDELDALSQAMEVHVLRGNHDGIDPEWPYFRFLNALPNVNFYSEPSVPKEGLLVLPHTRNWEQDWAGLDLDYQVILLHATVTGAEAEAGATLSGIPVSFFDDTEAMVLAGDVHVPQKIGKVEYVGAPYPIRFGDSFKPQALYFDSKGRRSKLYPPSIQRLSLVVEGGQRPEFPSIFEGDQCKIKVRLSKAESMEWHRVKTEIKGLCRELKVDLVSLELERLPEDKAVSLKGGAVAHDPTSTFSRYCNQKRISKDLREQGAALLKMTAANAVKTL